MVCLTIFIINSYYKKCWTESQPIYLFPLSLNGSYINKKTYLWTIHHVLLKNDTSSSLFVSQVSICTHFKHSWPWSKGYFYEENNPTNCVTFVVFCVYTTPNLFCLKTYVVIWSQTMYKDSHKVSCCVQHVSIVTINIQLLNLHQGKYPNKNQFNIFIDTNEY